MEKAMRIHVWLLFCTSENTLLTARKPAHLGSCLNTYGCHLVGPRLSTLHFLGNPKAFAFFLRLISYPPKRKQKTVNKHFLFFLFPFLHSQSLILTWSNSLSPLEERRELTSFTGGGEKERKQGRNLPIRPHYQFYLWLPGFKV